MMIRHVWSVLCQSVIVDKETNLPTYINSFNGLSLQGDIPTPIRLGSLVIGTCWWREVSGTEEPFKIRLSVKRPPNDDKELIIETQALFPEKANSFRLNINARGFAIDKEGLHFFILEKQNEKTNKWQEVASLPFNIQFLTANTVEEGALDTL
jgi:hypothetical protein